MQSNEGIFKKLYPIIIVTVVVFASTSLLSLVNRFTEPQILAREREASLGPLKEIFPDATGQELQDDIYIIKAGDSIIGYAYKTTATGYGGDIDIMVALQDENTVKGIAIVSQTETPGLGSRITLPEFAAKFVDKKIEDIMLKSEDGQIDAISGSTISSKAVVDAVRTTALEKIKALPK